MKTKTQAVLKMCSFVLQNGSHIYSLNLQKIGVIATFFACQELGLILPKKGIGCYLIV
jgi:hypothetical protein